MKTAIIASKEDIAGMNIKESLLKIFKFKETDEKFENNEILELEEDPDVKLYTINSIQTHFEDIDRKIDADLFIFVSRHSAKSGINALTCHPIGNFNDNDLGGEEKKLCIAPSILLKKALIELNKFKEKINHEVTLESTHHGPFLEKPVMFIELGSQESNWNNKDATNIIAQTLIKILKSSKNSLNFLGHKKSQSDFSVNNNKNLNNDKTKSTIVLGGSHYNYVANKLMLKSDIAVGHICPKHNLETLDEEMLNQMLEKTLPKPEFVMLDWKGLGKEKQRILELLKNNNIKFERSDKFF
jgi:D-aminoacyl-tRNA deacylase